MKITKTFSPRGCVQGACPSLHFTQEGNVIVQGARLPEEKPAGLRIPEHEDAVVMSQTVFADLLRQYQANP